MLNIITLNNNNNNNNNSVQFSAIGIHERAVLTVQVAIAKRAQRHKYSTRTVHTQKTKTLNGQNKNNEAGKTNK
jgi:hypothetical protein